MIVGVSYRNANQKQQQVEKLVYNNSFLDYNRKQRKKRFMIKVKRKLKLRVCEIERIIIVLQTSKIGHFQYNCISICTQPAALD